MPCGTTMKPTEIPAMISHCNSSSAKCTAQHKQSTTLHWQCWAVGAWGFFLNPHGTLSIRMARWADRWCTAFLTTSLQQLQLVPKCSDDMLDMLIPRPVVKKCARHVSAVSRATPTSRNSLIRYVLSHLTHGKNTCSQSSQL